MINAEDIATQWINPGEWPVRILKGKVQKQKTARAERRSEIMTGLFSGNVEISRAEYMTLVKESERNEVIRRLLKKNRNVSVEDLKAILCVEDEEAPKEEMPVEEKPEKQYSFQELLGE